mgnify:CR=1 FL=1
MSIKSLIINPGSTSTKIGVGRNADGVSDLSCEDAAEIGGMLSLHADLQVCEQCVRHRVCTAIRAPLPPRSVFSRTRHCCLRRP